MAVDCGRCRCRADKAEDHVQDAGGERHGQRPVNHREDRADDRAFSIPVPSGVCSSLILTELPTSRPVDRAQLLPTSVDSSANCAPLMTSSAMASTPTTPAAPRRGVGLARREDHADDTRQHTHGLGLAPLSFRSQVRPSIRLRRPPNAAIARAARCQARVDADDPAATRRCAVDTAPRHDCQRHEPPTANRSSRPSSRASGAACPVPETRHPGTSRGRRLPRIRDGSGDDQAQRRMTPVCAATASAAAKGTWRGRGRR